MKILVTGSAGFIGYHLVMKLIELKQEVVGLDNINDYYDVNMKYGRLRTAGIVKENIEYSKPIESGLFANYKFYKLNLEDRNNIDELFKKEKFDIVCNLAAQAGVPYSIINPYSYIESNISGFMNILECCRNYSIKHLVYASSSSVYGLNEKMPFSTSDNVDHPISIYAATKKSNELMAHVYSHLFGLPSTGLRFFTVYGPWGRPDMALFLFTKAILDGQPITVYNNGKMQRDFTYISDIVEGVVRVINHTPTGDENWTGIHPDPASSVAPFKIYNIGNNSPVNLLDFIESIENALGRQAKKKFMSLRPGDVPATCADVEDLVKNIDYKPDTPIRVGIKNFIDWYLDFYNIPNRI